MEKRFTPAELAQFDGLDGRPAYVAYQGRVYDVSASRLWPDGGHQRRHRAGQDLTAAITAAPHAPSVLERMPQVGVLHSDPVPAAPGGLIVRLLAYHPHPISVHFPIALIFAASAFAVFYLILGTAALLSAAYYTLLAGTVVAPLTVLFGILTWRYDYGGKSLPVFRAKLGLATLLIPLAIASVTLWALNPAALANREAIGWVYFTLLLVTCPLVLLLGNLGGSLVYPKK